MTLAHTHVLPQHDESHFLVILYHHQALYHAPCNPSNSWSSSMLVRLAIFVMFAMFVMFGMFVISAMFVMLVMFVMFVAVGLGYLRVCS